MKTKTHSSRKTIRLTKRDRRILDHMAQYRMTTLSAIHFLFYRGRKRAAAKSTLQRLRKARLISSVHLDQRRVYYHLTRKGAGRIGARKHVARPLGPQAIMKHYALHWFACMDDSGNRSMFRLRDHPEQFPTRQIRKPDAHFYLDVSDAPTTKLGCAIVDYGTPLKLRQKAGRVLSWLLTEDCFHRYVTEELLEFTLLVVDKNKRRDCERWLPEYLPMRLSSELAAFGVRNGDPLPFEVKVRCVPGLSDLLPESPKKDQP